MNINVREENHAVIFDVEGRIDVDDVSNFCIAINSYIGRGYKYVLFNMAEVTHISTIALGFFVSVYKSINEINGYFAVYGIRKELQNVLNITQLISVISFFDTEKQAQMDLNKFYKNKKVII